MRTVLFHFDRCPDVAPTTRFLHESCLRTKCCEDGLDVTAGVRVSIVFAHLFGEAVLAGVKNSE